MSHFQPCRDEIRTFQIFANQLSGPQLMKVSGKQSLKETNFRVSAIRIEMNIYRVSNKTITAKTVLDIVNTNTFNIN